MQIYDGRGTDLLHGGKAARRVGDLQEVVGREARAGEYHLSGISWWPLDAPSEAIRTLRLGEGNRVQCETVLNKFAPPRRLSCRSTRVAAQRCQWCPPTNQYVGAPSRAAPRRSIFPCSL